MSESRVVVPEGGLEAAVAAAWKHIGFDYPQASPRIQKEIEDGYRAGLEAFVRWLSENPMVPTHSEVNSILAMVQFQSLRGTSLDGLQDFAAMWQRRMFLAPPEPEVGQAAKRVMENMMGCTFTPTEADAILRELSFVAHGWRVPSTASCPACDHGQSLERGEGTHREGARQHPVEPEVSPSTELYRAFHRAWSSKVRTEGYNKDDWNKLDSLLNRCLYPQKSAELP